MATSIRNADAACIAASVHTFFATAKTAPGCGLLQSERNALLLIDVLRTFVVQGQFQLHDFVIMPDRIHLLMTVKSKTGIDHAMRLVKGGFSYRLRKETGYPGQVWERGFSEVRVEDGDSREQHQRYIRETPVKTGLCDSPDQYPFCFTYLVHKRYEG